MRPLVFLLAALLFSACSAELTVEERAALAADAEVRVVLPEGSGDLSCYLREYSIVREQNTPDGKAYLVGEYHLATPYMGMENRNLKPGIAWKERDDLVMGFVDQGCQTLWFNHPLDDVGSPIRAKCAPTLNGTFPTKVSPPVDC
jgi:hypothetical protein